MGGARQFHGIAMQLLSNFLGMVMGLLGSY